MVKQSKTGDMKIAEENSLKTKAAIKRIKNSKEYKDADFAKKTRMLGGKFATQEDMESEVGLRGINDMSKDYAKGGRAKLKGGGMSQRGLGKAFKNGGRS